MELGELFDNIFFKRLTLLLLFGVLVGGGIYTFNENVYVTGTTVNSALPIYSVETDEKVVSLTFDAAWGTEDLDQILEILAKYDIKATFFMTGQWVSEYPEAVEKIVAAGHDVGSHGDNHKHMSQLSEEENLKEIKGAHDKVKSLTGKEMCLFRAPYGDYDEELVKTVEDKTDYYMIQWDVDSLDWKDYGVESIVDKVVNNKNLKSGSIILLHNGSKYTKDALEQVITGLIEKGYSFLPVSKLIYRDNYSIDHTGRQCPEEKK